MNRPFEIINTLTAGFGMILSYIGFFFIIFLTIGLDSYWKLVCCSVYGLTLVMLHTSSAFYHGVVSSRIKKNLKLLDHSSIYLLIAGTYTPICLISLGGGWGWSIFGVVWGLCLLGIFLKLMNLTPFKNYENYLYLGMGWLALIGIIPIINNIQLGGIILIFLGGLLFTIGILFYIWDNKKYFHAIWHFFVIGGCLCHYFTIIFYVILAPIKA